MTGRDQIREVAVVNQDQDPEAAVVCFDQDQKVAVVNLDLDQSRRMLSLCRTGTSSRLWSLLCLRRSRRRERFSRSVLRTIRPMETNGSCSGRTSTTNLLSWAETRKHTTINRTGFRTGRRNSPICSIKKFWIKRTIS